MTAAQHARECLAASRRAGMSFELAWTRAVADAPGERDELAALDWARAAFERAYHDQPPAGRKQPVANIIELRRAVDELPPAA